MAVWEPTEYSSLLLEGLTMPKYIKVPVDDPKGNTTVYFLNNLQNLADRVREGVLPSTFLADELQRQIDGILLVQGFSITGEDNEPTSNT
jgi:hypothetical protein